MKLNHVSTTVGQVLRHCTVTGGGILHSSTNAGSPVKTKANIGRLLAYLYNPSFILFLRRNTGTGEVFFPSHTLTSSLSHNTNNINYNVQGVPSVRHEGRSVDDPLAGVRFSSHQGHAMENDCRIIFRSIALRFVILGLNWLLPVMIKM